MRLDPSYSVSCRCPGTENSGRKLEKFAAVADVSKPLIVESLKPFGKSGIVVTVDGKLVLKAATK